MLTGNQVMDAVVRAVAVEWGVSTGDILSLNRSKRSVEARNVCFLLGADRGLSAEVIGQAMDRNPLTIGSGTSRVSGRKCPVFRGQLDAARTRMLAILATEIGGDAILRRAMDDLVDIATLFPDRLPGIAATLRAVRQVPDLGGPVQ
ncbi:hypothetical protein [Rhodospirillum sp. A1_3_36]|uniref:hypothetical protein n=1 Tax=Rhodospirillum sp. A1_3_36 TaxID=3391666 RepID=UPI0039A4BADE